MNSIVSLRSSIRFVLLIGVLFFFSGCFEILEEITLKSNGSGTFTYTVNMSQSKAKLASIMALDSVDGHKVPKQNDIIDQIKKAQKTLQGISGISNVAPTWDFTNYIFVMKFDFNNTTTLNQALLTLAQTMTKDKDKAKVPASISAFAFANNVFSRKNEYNSKAEIDKLKSKDVDILKTSSYTCIYRFDSEVKSCSNTDAKISSNKKNVMLKLNMLELLKGDKKIQNTITLN
jgi:hypothetical protein